TSNTSPNGTGASCVAHAVDITRSMAKLKTLSGSFATHCTLATASFTASATLAGLRRSRDQRASVTEAPD
ncbi:hypothetical protein ABZX85_35235, partial [Streptomyces sp. NPDC004539]|uniref:hypothetical protein n=1 Tax=Streptomyces sp. NPDC004539 TaxID=3154280 RepID=UPI0033A55398